MTDDIPRKRLRETGVPDDMSAGDVKAFFSLPDDDDSMHQQGPRADGGDRCRPRTEKDWSPWRACPACGALGPWFENGDCVAPGRDGD